MLSFGCASPDGHLQGLRGQRPVTRPRVCSQQTSPRTMLMLTKVKGHRHGHQPENQAPGQWGGG